MIQPDQIPQFTGNLPQLETDHAALKKDAGNVRKTGEDVHSKFQGLSAYYTAPEAEQLFATTKPVKDRADTFADDLETVSSALSSYATEIRPLVDKLKQLKADATTFVTSGQGRRRVGVRRGQGRRAQPDPGRDHHDGGGVLGC